MSVCGQRRKPFSRKGMRQREERMFDREMRRSGEYGKTEERDRDRQRQRQLRRSQTETEIEKEYR